jgi:tetratricopeptide (TPR) repeat protein
MVKVAFTRIAVALALASAVAGCAENKPKPAPPPPSYDQLMQQADARFNAQDVDGAKGLYVKAAAADPTHKEPWYRLAQIDFDQQSYGKAIVDAQEVLQRDPTDVNAESILTIAGLRVAVDALGRLHDESDQQGPAHMEAVKLAAKMRETLGQDVLVPPATKPKRRVHHTAPAADTANQTPATPGSSSPSAPSSAPQSAPAGSNPFQALPGGH